jgi:threonine/homoserine/homoserine lactone efflux protein
MPTALSLVAKGVALGLGAAVPIGPVNVQIARRTLRWGFWQGFALGCGAVTADVTYAALGSLGLRRFFALPPVEWTVRVGGVLLLAYLGALCLRGEREAFHADPIAAGRSADAPGAESRRAAYFTGLAMTLFNPMTLAFWFVAVPALVGSVADDVAQELPAVAAGVFIGTLAWVVTFSAALALAGRFRRNWWLAAADAAGGFTLLVFAAAALLSSLKALL